MMKVTVLFTRAVSFKSVKRFFLKLIKTPLGPDCPYYLNLLQ